MKSFLSSYDVVSEIVMVRTKFKGAIVLMEGDTDCNVLDAFVDSSTALTLPAHGKQRVIDGVQLALSSGIPAILGICDADYDRINGTCISHPHIIVTEFHDFEMMIAMSSSFDRLALNYCKRNTIEVFMAGKSHTDFRSFVLRLAATVGMLRLASLNHNMGLRFRDLDFRAVVDTTSFEISSTALVAAVFANSRVPSVSQAFAEAEHQRFERAALDDRQVACGHDLAAILAIVLEVVCSCSGDIVERRNVEKMLRVGFGRADFEPTQLCQNLHAWETANRPYQILRK